MSQKRQVPLILLLEALLVVIVAAAVASRWVPVGVPGEWEWNRLADWATLPWDGLAIAVAGVAVYAGFVGARVASAFAPSRSRMFEAACVTGLYFASVCIQVIVPMGAPAGYDLTKWASVNYLPGSTGYFQIARQKAAADPWKFLADYPEWIRNQDVFHIGTHPPGLIAAQCLFLRVMEQNPGLTRRASRSHASLGRSGLSRFRHIRSPNRLTRAERATLYATALLTLLACAGTVVPLYLLARAALPASRVMGRGGALAACARAPTCFSRSPTRPIRCSRRRPWRSACWAVREPRTGHTRSDRQVAAGGRFGNGHGAGDVVHAGVPSRRADRGAHGPRNTPGNLANACAF